MPRNTVYIWYILRPKLISKCSSHLILIKLAEVLFYIFLFSELISSLCVLQVLEICNSLMQGFSFCVMLHWMTEKFVCLIGCWSCDIALWFIIVHASVWIHSLFSAIWGSHEWYLGKSVWSRWGFQLVWLLNFLPLYLQIFIHLHMVTTKRIKDGCQECSAVKAIIEGPWPIDNLWWKWEGLHFSGDNLKTLNPYRPLPSWYQV